MPMRGDYQLLDDKETDAYEPPKKSWPWRAVSIAAGFIIGFAVLSTVVDVPSTLYDSDDHPRLKKCASTLPLIASPPAPLNLWASLSVDETVKIQSWLDSPARNLNLTSGAGTGAYLSDNVVFLIEAYRPPKADAVAYLDSPDTVSSPTRFARVTIQYGALQVPTIKDYLVGPLPVGPETKMSELTDIYHRDIPYNARGFNLYELPLFLGRVVPPLADAMQDLFNGTARGLSNDTLVAAASAPFGLDGKFRRAWIAWRRNIPGMWLHPIGFFMYVDMSSTDTNNWKILKVVYNNQVFPSTEAFLQAYNDKTLKRLPLRPDQNTNEWSTRMRTGVQRDLDHLPGPRSVSFAGLRFRVAYDTQYISWMGWGMYFGFDRDMGLSLWDIRLKGERIIYQLAPQEAIAQYAGNDPFQSTTAWLDRYFGMGASVRNMLPGYDCPHEAVYFPATTNSQFGSTTVDRAICVFEQDTGRPITRHTGYMHAESGAVKGYQLTVRSICTVGNYDYLFDYMFQIDGTIEVRVSASGYLQGGFWNAEQEGYGTPIQETTMGSLHDHVINYKVDLDIKGTDNSMLFTKTSQEEVEQPWFDEDWGSTVLQQKITREYITNEDDAKVRYPDNFQGGYSIVNKDVNNSWEMPRGYAIHPGYSPIHNTVVGSRRLLNNANWARYNLAVSLRKETEPSSSSMWNLHLSSEPVVDFHKFFDGENITQQDLVAWVNVGTHHIPQSEDSPNTRTNTATSSFFITPSNYFDADISIESTNAILIEPQAKSGYTWDDYGVNDQEECRPAQPPPFVYEPAKSFDPYGKPITGESNEQLRKAAEMYHRVKVEL